ncbi:DUF1642 domain-containing protein [Lactococcus lactis]|uniref:DUF1642 domain-containing protein n=2 Tax=Lactococcus lactis TaxID=1358 RepID=UPI00223A7E11|nr:DUF1642 domain-containing protein [Lactococcus lactis]MCT0028230.1 DUF1642 domain-containing protein [Lactococcus lactis subsp. lactis]MCT3107055.1 DUF1642 domain-containing protein [Lactococcus lactis]
MTKFEEEFNYLIELSGKVLLGQVDAETFEKNRIEFFEKYETDQQQALPVVPECVGEFVSGDETELSKADRIAYLLKSVEGDNYYLEEYLTNAGIISQEQGEHLYAWATNQTHETILELWNGYQVEKPQLFYLRDELTGQFLAKDNQFKNEDRYFFWTGADPLTHSIGTAWKLTFTQQEIDSMQTGSYELVPVEDGE